jgi:hypothetical protein
MPRIFFFFLFLVGLYVYQTEIRERKVFWEKLKSAFVVFCLAPFQQKKVKWNRQFCAVAVYCRQGPCRYCPVIILRVRGGRFITQQERRQKKIVSKENSKRKKRLDISLDYLITFIPAGVCVWSPCPSTDCWRGRRTCTSPHPLLGNLCFSTSSSGKKEPGRDVLTVRRSKSFSLFYFNFVGFLKFCVYNFFREKKYIRTSSSLFEGKNKRAATSADTLVETKE